MIKVIATDVATMPVTVSYAAAGLYVSEGVLLVEDDKGCTVGVHAPGTWRFARREQPGPLFEERLRHLLADAYDGIDPDVDTRHEQAAREILALLAAPEVTG